MTRLTGAPATRVQGGDVAAGEVLGVGAGAAGAGAGAARGAESGEAGAATTRAAGVRRSGAPAPGPLVLGVRHHGPGSARAVAAALDAGRPKAVLIEGPPEGDALVALAADEEMRPPVALLAHAVDDPGRAAFWPMAAFSPEWVALRWALAHGAAVRFIDLPAAHTLAATDPTWGDEDEVADRGLRVDPVAELAQAAGHDDAERWWEDVVELRGAADPFAPFEALAEAMGALREAYGDGGHPRDLVREAYMRIQLRAAQKEFGDDVAVVCGAWHVPALLRKGRVTADRALLKGLPKVKTELTWVPWTNRRLARRSGYGAGIDAPGWYAHLFSAPDRPVERWMTKVAGLLRDEDLPVSSAHVIEAVRLADTLAVLRGRPLPGLGETVDAVRAVMGDGSDVPLDLVRDRLVVGDVLGTVPAGAPAVPLQRDLERLQRALRLKPEARERELELDLRKDNDAARSRLLHRLRLLGVGWGAPVAGRGSTGTFRESWRLRWEPELHVQVAEAGVWGTTVEAAATAKAAARAAAAQDLATVTALAEQCLLAGLGDALPAVLQALADRAALDADVAHLAQALPALARSLRYGDVRATDTTALAEVAAGLAERICVGLPPACAGLDPDAATEMRDRLDAVHTAIALLPAHPARAEPPQAHPGAPPPSTGPEPGSAPDEDVPARADEGPPTEAEAAGTPAGQTHAAGREAAGPAGREAAGPEAAGPASARPDHHRGPADARTAAADGDRPAHARTGLAGPEAAVPDAVVPEAVPDAAASEAVPGAPGPGHGGPAQPPARPSEPHTGLASRWSGVLWRLVGRERVPGVLRGRAARLLFDEGRIGEGEAARLMGLALSPGTPPADAAAWIEGFVGGASGGGLLLVHDERLLGLVDDWLGAVPAEAFTDVLPLLRRTFAAYETGVRRTLGELVARGPATAGPGRPAAVPGFAPDLDEGRADAVLPLLHLILGTEASV
ncbi:DUF5682 family protein [Streptomyces roseoviridis]|uniref:DUF5682 family protein n=1 Tax=Streptomyces roseoviridis TaxID=67361 RepID=A0ABV5QJS4_9ACTN